MFTRMSCFSWFYIQIYSNVSFELRSCICSTVSLELVLYPNSTFTRVSCLRWFLCSPYIYSSLFWVVLCMDRNSNRVFLLCWFLCAERTLTRVSLDFCLRMYIYSSVSFELVLCTVREFVRCLFWTWFVYGSYIYDGVSFDLVLIVHLLEFLFCAGFVSRSYIYSSFSFVLVLCPDCTLTLVSILSWFVTKSYIYSRDSLSWFYVRIVHLLVCLFKVVLYQLSRS